MSQPSGFEKNEPSLVYKLHKTLYGLKQTPNAWYEKLTQALVPFGFIYSKCYHSLYIYSHQGITIYALVYVDDIPITGSPFMLIHKFIDSFHDKFPLKTLGTSEYFLGIEIKHLLSGNLLLTQSKNICDLHAK